MRKQACRSELILGNWTPGTFDEAGLASADGWLVCVGAAELATAGFGFSRDAD
jgi:hypothetical protein